MPEQPASPTVGLSPLNKKLRIRITVIFLLLAVLITGIVCIVNVRWLANNGGASLINSSYYYQLVILPTLAISLFLTLAAIYLVWRRLKPLEALYQGAQILAKGELDHRINIHSGDEIEFISYSLNSLAQNLSGDLKRDTLAKEQIISERNKLDTIISSIVDGVIVLDMHRNIILANKAATKITGYETKEMLGQLIDTLISLKDKDGQTIDIKEYCLVNPTRPTPTQTKFIANLAGKGQQLQVRATIAPIAEGLQADLGCILILHDITQDNVFQQMQIDFVSMASHEIRTPLTSITNYLSIISEEGSTQLNSELREFLSRALISARQLAVLVDNLLNVSKIERNSVSIALQPLDWQKNLTRIVDNNRVQAIQKNISLELKVPTYPLPKIDADEIRINEVLNNLINNAIAYTKEGGHIEVGSRVAGNELITYVADSGTGIPKEAIPHLFTKFFRVAGSLDKGSKGTGLGLYISKSVIDMHHGKIWVESEVGKGSTFYFSLPINHNPNQTPTIVQLHSSVT